MGEFSWMYADKKNKKPLNIGCTGYVACPDGTFIYEDGYDGYGNFGGYDVYELVVDWNRDMLDADMLRKPVRSMWAPDEEGLAWYRKGLERYGDNLKRLYDWKSHNVTADEMAKRYGKNWKRDLGIDISCYDEQNAALPYPIKIVSAANIPYSDLPASMGDENQGWGSEHWQ